MAEGTDIENEFVKACLAGDSTRAAELLRMGADAGQRIPRTRDHRSGTVLHAAAAQGQTDILNLLLSHGSFIESRDQNIQTPLHRACAAGQYEAADILIKHGARVNFNDFSSGSPLHLACEAGASEIVRLLLDHNADVNSVIGGDGSNDEGGLFESDLDEFLNSGKSPLYIAYDNNRGDVAGILLDNGARFGPLGTRSIHLACLLNEPDWILTCLAVGDKINVRDEEGRTPLHIAARAGHVICVQLCLERKAKFNKTDKRGRSALHYAVEENHEDVVAHLLSYTKSILVTVADGDDCTPLRLACNNNNFKIVELLVNFDPELLDIDSTAIFVTKDNNIIAFLLNAGVRVNCKDFESGTLLHKACRKGDADLFDLLLRCGAKVNAPEKLTGLSPLHIACREGHTDMALTLIQNGADVNSQELRNSFSPIHFACETGNIKIVEALLALGCHLYGDPSEQEGWMPPIEVATKKGYVEIVERLLEQAAKTDDERDFITKIQQPLYIACEQRHPKLVQLFMKNGACVDAFFRESRLQLFDVVIHSYTRCLENGDRGASANDVISILMNLINAGCRIEHFFTNMGHEISQVYEIERLFDPRKRVSRFLMMTGIDIFNSLGDAYLMSLLRDSDMETLRMLASCGYRFSETLIEDLCSRFEDGDVLLAEVRESILQLPTLQDICRLKIRCVLRQNLHRQQEQRRKRHLSRRIGDFWRKFAGKKRKRLPLYGINNLIESLPVPTRVKDFLCFNLFDAS